jgi:hypothetical protein
MSCTVKFKDGKFCHRLVHECKDINTTSKLTCARSIDMWPLPPPMSTTLGFFNDDQPKLFRNTLRLSSTVARLLMMKQWDNQSVDIPSDHPLIDLEKIKALSGFSSR